MPDIMMCENGSCPSAETCYRHRAIPCDLIQSWGIGLAPDDSGRCDSYWPTDGRGRLRPFPVPKKATSEPVAAETASDHVDVAKDH